MLPDGMLVELRPPMSHYVKRIASSTFLVGWPTGHTCFRARCWREARRRAPKLAGEVKR